MIFSRCLGYKYNVKDKVLWEELGVIYKAKVLARRVNSDMFFGDITYFNEYLCQLEDGSGEWKKEEDIFPDLS